MSRGGARVGRSGLNHDTLLESETTQEVRGPPELKHILLLASLKASEMGHLQVATPEEAEL